MILWLMLIALRLASNLLHLYIIPFHLILSPIVEAQTFLVLIRILIRGCLMPVVSLRMIISSTIEPWSTWIVPHHHWISLQSINECCTKVPLFNPLPLFFLKPFLLCTPLLTVTVDEHRHHYDGCTDNNDQVNPSIAILLYRGRGVLMECESNSLVFEVVDGIVRPQEYITKDVDR